MSKMRKAITPREVEKILFKMGFEKRATRGSHHVFSHPDSKAIVLLPSQSRHMRMAHLSAVRRTVIEQGILSKEEVDKLLMY